MQSGCVDSEVPLAGGTVASVVRVGETVRRSQDRWSPAVHDLLLHLEAVGFDGAPRFLGIDESGREILSWISGDPGTRPWPAALLTDQGVEAAARLLRRYHDAVASFRPSPDAEWWIGKRPLREGEIVCHGDVGPWNTIWRSGHPVALIDWDFVEPAPAIVDVAELAFFITPMGDSAAAAASGLGSAALRRRLHRFCEAYGDVEPSAVLSQALLHWEEDTRRILDRGPKGIAPWDELLARGLVDDNHKFVRWLEAHADYLS